MRNNLRNSFSKTLKFVPYTPYNNILKGKDL